MEGSRKSLTDDEISMTEADHPDSYPLFAREIVDTRIISDPWVEGKERFRLEPEVIPSDLRDRFFHAIESVGQAYDEMIGLLHADPDLVERHFHLTGWQQIMWIASAGLWHGIARGDAFVLEDGSIRICELNADTPSGEPEAVVLNSVRKRFHPELSDPNREFRRTFIRMVDRSYRATFGDLAPPPRVGIVYPTDLPEDLSMIELYREWFQEEGWEVELGSPYNLARDGRGFLTLLGRPITLVLRHYKTDWWGEREPVLIDDEEYRDPDPLEEPLRAILGADVDGKVAVVNPFGAILAQNKLAMAFLHSEIERLSEPARQAVRDYIPFSVRLTDIPADQLIDERERWVLKSDFGCEGDEVVIGPMATDEYWERMVRNARPERWIAQEYFVARSREDGTVPNYGLFLIGGEAGGIFTRFSSASTDYRAMTAPTFVRGED